MPPLSTQNTQARHKVSVFLGIPLPCPLQVPHLCPPKQVCTHPLPISAATSLVRQTCFLPALLQLSPNPSPCGLDLLQSGFHSAARVKSQFKKLHPSVKCSS